MKRKKASKRNLPKRKTQLKRKIKTKTNRKRKMKMMTKINKVEINSNNPRNNRKRKKAQEDLMRKSQMKTQKRKNYLHLNNLLSVNNLSFNPFYPKFLALVLLSIPLSIPSLLTEAQPIDLFKFLSKLTKFPDRLLFQILHLRNTLSWRIKTSKSVCSPKLSFSKQFHTSKNQRNNHTEYRMKVRNS